MICLRPFAILTIDGDWAKCNDSLTNNIVTGHTVGIENVSSTAAANFNLFFGNSSNLVGTIANSNSLVSDPTFVNASTNDFRLVIGSPAIDSGTNAGVTTDILGVARPLNAGFDRGAYEGQFTPTAVRLTTLTAYAPAPVWLMLMMGLLLICISFLLRQRPFLYSLCNFLHDTA